MNATTRISKSPLFKTFIFIICVAASSYQSNARTSVPSNQALSDATKIAQRYNWEVYKGTGKSMAPSFGPTSFLLVKKLSADSIKTGMTILFHDYKGDTVAHRVIGQTENGMLITRGINNPKNDPYPIGADQIIGALVGTIDSNQALDRFNSIPSAMGKTYP